MPRTPGASGRAGRLRAMDNVIQLVTVYAIPVLFAITLHEAAHGYVARMFGDNTAFVAGRISLNPLRHIDPIGTVVVPLVMVALSGFMFGWARPVPVDFGSLRKPKRDMIWVAGAGPGANLVMAIGWVLFAKLLALLGVEEDYFFLVANAGVSVNLVFMALNLIPIPPLDGGRIAVGLLPNRLAYQYAKLEPYGMFIIIALLVTGALNVLLRPFLQMGESIVRLFM
jgi:Zn-dependent protease